MKRLTFLKGVEKSNRAGSLPWRKCSPFRSGPRKLRPIAACLQTLIAVHLHSHSYASEHALRTKYGSAVHKLRQLSKKKPDMF